MFMATAAAVRGRSTERAMRDFGRHPEDAERGAECTEVASQPDISTLLETGHFYLGLTLPDDYPGVLRLFGPPQQLDQLSREQRRHYAAYRSRALLQGW